MANVRRTAREIRLEAIVELQNELNQLRNENPVDEQWVHKYNNYKLYELGEVKERLTKTIEAEKFQKKVDEFFAGEGASIKAEIESRKQLIRETYKAIQEEIESIAEKAFEGTVWTVQRSGVNAFTAYIELGMVGENGLYIHHNDFELKYERKWLGNNEAEFTTNIGTCGSQDVLDDSFGSRTFYYIQVGMLLQDKAKLEKLRDDMAALCNRMGELDDMKRRIENVEADPFTNKLED
jgi:hypothetical protein